MPRIQRVDISGYIYHVLNRANARMQIFDNNQDYLLFDKMIEEMKERFNLDIYSYCLMPNHWHMVVSPKNDGGLQKSMQWLGNSHTRRWHSMKNTIGQGSLYQGRYKSFISQGEHHLLTLIKYVEKNPKKSNLVDRAENWRWGSLWRIIHGSTKQKQLLSDWSILRPKDYLQVVNSYDINKTKEENDIELSVKRGSPFGDIDWRDKLVNKFEQLKSTLKSVGRPQKGA